MTLLMHLGDEGENTFLLYDYFVMAMDAPVHELPIHPEEL